MSDSPPTPSRTDSATGLQPLGSAKSRWIDKHELGRWDLEWNCLADELDRVALRMTDEHNPRNAAVATYAAVNSVALRLEQLIRRGNAPETSKVWLVARDDVGGYFTFLGVEGSGWDQETMKATQFARRADADKASRACHVATHVIEIEIETIRPCVTEAGRGPGDDT